MLGDAEKSDPHNDNCYTKWQVSLGGLFACMTLCSVWMAFSKCDPVHYGGNSVSCSGFLALTLLGMRGTFRKAGHPGWAAFVPIYNLVVMTRIGGWSSWWAVLLLIPPVNLVAYLGISVGIARRFGHGDLFGGGLALFPPVFYLILGFGSSKYRGDLDR